MQLSKEYQKYLNEFPEEYLKEIEKRNKRWAELSARQGDLGKIDIKKLLNRIRSGKPICLGR